MQKHGMGFQGTKGNTIFFYDNQEQEKVKFADLIKNQEEWSKKYYSSGKGGLDQIIDVSYFADSKHVYLIQLADLCSFLLRRYAEIKEGLRLADYEDEERLLEGWVEDMMERSIGSQYMYPKRNRLNCHNLFYECAPESIREL